MELPEVLPTRHPDVEVAEFETEFVVFDPRTRVVHHLEAIHAFVFDGCDGTTTLGTLVNELHVDAIDDAQERLETTLLELAELGLLEGTESPSPPPPCIGCGDDEPTRTRRRRFARR